MFACRSTVHVHIRFCVCVCVFVHLQTPVCVFASACVCISNSLLYHLSVQGFSLQRHRYRFKASVMTLLSSTLNANSTLVGFYSRCTDAYQNSQASDFLSLTQTLTHSH